MISRSHQKVERKERKRREDKKKNEKYFFISSSLGQNTIFLRLFHKYRLLHRKCAVRTFINELQNFEKRTSERSERVGLPKFCNE